jgi:DNA helicase-2/ATP-dependent DNA helicase PcrA
LSHGLVRLWGESGLSAEAIAPGESRIVTPEHIAVLGRTAASLRRVEAELAARNTPYAVSSSESEWASTTLGNLVVDLIAYKGASSHHSVRRRLSVACDSVDRDWNDLADVLAAAPGDIHKFKVLCACPTPSALIDRLVEVDIEGPDWAADVRLLVDTWNSFVDEAGPSGRTFGNFRQYIYRAQRGNDLAPGVRLLTVHKAQGREFKAVAVVGCTDGQFPDFRARTREDRLSELRAFYVAISRASRQLLLTWPQVRETRYGLRSTDRSPFMEYVTV